MVFTPWVLAQRQRDQSFCRLEPSTFLIVMGVCSQGTWILTMMAMGRRIVFTEGLRNLTAALDVSKATFPEPTKILLAGSSGGGFGTVIAAILVRIMYPGVPLVIMNDSGIGVAKDDDKGFIRRLLEEWNAMSLVLAGREDLLINGHLSDFIKWQFERGPTTPRVPLSLKRFRRLRGVSGN